MSNARLLAKQWAAERMPTTGPGKRIRKTKQPRAGVAEPLGRGHFAGQHAIASTADVYHVACGICFACRTNGISMTDALAGHGTSDAQRRYIE